MTGNKGYTGNTSDDTTDDALDDTMDDEPQGRKYLRTPEPPRFLRQTLFVHFRFPQKRSQGSGRHVLRDENLKE